MPNLKKPKSPPKKVKAPNSAAKLASTTRRVKAGMKRPSKGRISDSDVKAAMRRIRNAQTTDSNN